MSLYDDIINISLYNVIIVVIQTIDSYSFECVVFHNLKHSETGRPG